MNSPTDASAATAEIAQELPAPAEPHTWREKLRNTATAVMLGGISLAATMSEYSGNTERMDEVPRLIASSCAHPVLGYVGAWAADRIYKNEGGKIRKTAMLLGATVANFVTETAQSFIVASPAYADFLSTRNLPETAKDYAFSLIGMGVYMFQNRRKANSEPNPI